jgi:putative ABC transport system permease protein
MRLIRVPPLRVLRRDLPPLPVAAWVSAIGSGTALLILIAWYAGDAKLVGVFVGALAGLIGVLALLARLALLAGRGVQRMAHGPLRLARATAAPPLRQHPAARRLHRRCFWWFAVLVRRIASPAGAGNCAAAPSYFLNIAPHQQEGLLRIIAASPQGHALPMVRGRR